MSIEAPTESEIRSLNRVVPVQDQITPPDHLTLEIYLTHQNCPNADLWRNEGGEGFPRFKAVVHERYNHACVSFRCEACPTVIQHTIANRSKVESL